MKKSATITLVLILTVLPPLAVTSTCLGDLTILWQTDFNESELNSIQRVVLTPDGSSILAFHETPSAVVRVENMDVSTGGVNWSQAVPVSGVGLAGWIDNAGDTYLGRGTVTKYDAQFSTPEWSYSGGSGFQVIMNILTDDPQNVFVAGYQGGGTGQGSRAVKLDSSGGLVWEHLSDKTGGADNYGMGMALDSSGNLYRVGWDRLDPAILSSIRGRIIGHGAANGAEIMTTVVAETNSVMRSVFIDANDDLYIGYTYDVFSGKRIKSGIERSVVQKLDLQGNVLWEHRFSDVGMYLRNNSIHRATENTFYVVYETNVAGLLYPGIAEFNGDGALLWSDIIDRPGWESTGGLAVTDGVAYLGLREIEDFSQTQVLAVQVPEPATMAPLVLGGLAVLRRRSHWRRHLVRRRKRGMCK